MFYSGWTIATIVGIAMMVIGVLLIAYRFLRHKRGEDNQDGAATIVMIASAVFTFGSLALILGLLGNAFYR